MEAKCPRKLLLLLPCSLSRTEIFFDNENRLTGTAAMLLVCVERYQFLIERQRSYPRNPFSQGFDQAALFCNFRRSKNRSSLNARGKG